MPGGRRIVPLEKEEGEISFRLVKGIRATTYTKKDRPERGESLEGHTMYLGKKKLKMVHFYVHDGKVSLFHVPG